MNVLIDKIFAKDTNAVHDNNLINRLADCIQMIINAQGIDKISNIKKLTGYKNAYRIKLGDYRIGLIISGNQVELIRFLHRKDIYKYFP